jgi:hypothetical protein
MCRLESEGMPSKRKKRREKMATTRAAYKIQAPGVGRILDSAQKVTKMHHQELVQRCGFLARCWYDQCMLPR